MFPPQAIEAAGRNQLSQPVNIPALAPIAPIPAQLDLMVAIIVTTEQQSFFIARMIEGFMD